MKKVHQIYGKAATRVACGTKITNVTKTALPHNGVTCERCLKVETARQRDGARRRKTVMKKIKSKSILG